MGSEPSLLALERGLTTAQRAYLHAVAKSAEPYEPRHGRTANWAARHGLTDTVVSLNNGEIGQWESFDVEHRASVGIASIMGQVLSAKGLALRAHLTGTGEDK